MRQAQIESSSAERGDAHGHMATSIVGLRTLYATLQLGTKATVRPQRFRCALLRHSTPLRLRKWTCAEGRRRTVFWKTEVGRRAADVVSGAVVVPAAWLAVTAAGLADAVDAEEAGPARAAAAARLPVKATACTQQTVPQLQQVPDHSYTGLETLLGIAEKLRLQTDHCNRPARQRRLKRLLKKRTGLCPKEAMAVHASEQSPLSAVDKQPGRATPPWKNYYQVTPANACGSRPGRLWRRTVL